MGIFKIEAENLGWINGAKDDPSDLCLHGHAVFFIFRTNHWTMLLFPDVQME